MSRWVTVLLVILAACVSWELSTIRSGWEVLLEVGAGTGSVYLLRWYWWRVNAWSEIAAMTTALVVSVAIRWSAPFHGSEAAVFAKQTLVTTAVTTAAWIVVSLCLTPAGSPAIRSPASTRRGSGLDVSRLEAHSSDRAPDVVPTFVTSGTICLQWIVGCAMIAIRN